MIGRLILIALLIFAFTCGVFSQSTDFTFQGSVKDGVNAASGTYDFEFALYDALSGPNQIGATLARNNVAVAAGIFSVNLDFGNQFPGTNRFLEIRLKVSGAPAFTTLTPRQLVGSSPYSVKSLNADNAANATNANTAQNSANATNPQNAVNATNAVSAVSFTGPLAGDITGSQSATVVSKLSGQTLSTSIPVGGQVLKYNGGTNRWEPGADANSGGTINGVVAGTGLNGGGVAGTVNVGIAPGGVTATELGANAVTTTKILDGNVTDAKIASLTAGKLTGVVSTANGGTSLNAPGPSGNYLRSTGTTWASSALQQGDMPNLSASYIRNSPVQQPGGTFNISGDGIVGGLLSVGTAVTTRRFEVVGGSFFGGPTSARNGFDVDSNGAFDGSFSASNLSRLGFGNSGAGTGEGIGSKRTVGGNRFGLDFYTAHTSRMSITSAGDVGIGIANPVTSLHVVGNVAKATPATVRSFVVSTNDPYPGPGNPASPFALDIRLVGAADLADRAAFLQTTDIDTMDGGNMLFQPQGGNVGIGTMSPTKKLQVVGESLFVGPMNVQSGLSVDRSGQFNGDFMNNNFRLNFGNEASSSGEGMGSKRTAGGNQFGLDIYTNRVARISVTNAGLVGINTAIPSATLSVNGTANKPGGGSWDVFSDERLKNVKGNFNRGLNAVMKLQPIRYKYREDNVLGLKSESENIGFAAQALQKVIPEAVTMNSNGYLMVNNDPVIWTLLNAIKEQQTEITRQQRNFENLRRDNASLKARLDRLERSKKAQRRKR